MHPRHYFLFLESLHFLSQFQQQQERRGQNMNNTKYVSHTDFLLQVTSIFHFSLWWHLMLSCRIVKEEEDKRYHFLVGHWLWLVAKQSLKGCHFMPSHLSLYIMFVHAFLTTLPCLKNIIQGLERQNALIAALTSLMLFKWNLISAQNLSHCKNAFFSA